MQNSSIDIGQPIACRVQTPVGVLTALYNSGVIVRVLFPDEPPGAGYQVIDDALPFAIQIGRAHV